MCAGRIDAIRGGEEERAQCNCEKVSVGCRGSPWINIACGQEWPDSRTLPCRDTCWDPQVLLCGHNHRLLVISAFYS